MGRRKTFSVVDALRWDMHKHGSTFIIYEFLIASLIVAWVFISSLRYYSSRPAGLSSILWILFFAGILLNCIIIMLIALRIKKHEGNRPTPKYDTRMEYVALILIIFILTPLMLPIVAYREFRQGV